MADQKIDNQALEEAIEAFVADRQKDSYVKVMELLERSVVLMPATEPGNLDPETQRLMREGKPVQLPREARILPCILRKESGEQALPVYTSSAQIPQDKKSPAVLALPFFACVSMASANQDKVAAVVVNPFTHNMVLNQAVLEVAEKRRKLLAAQAAGQGQNAAGQASAGVGQDAAAQGGTGQKIIQLTEKQFQDLTHNRVALFLLPKYLFDKQEEGLKKLQQEEGEFLLHFYEEVYPAGRKPPCQAEDFSVMTLNVTEVLQITRVDMPDEAARKGMCYRVYAVWKRDTREVFYYALESTKEGNLIARITPEGKHEAVEPVPENGAEIEEIMSLVTTM